MENKSKFGSKLLVKNFGLKMRNFGQKNRKKRHFGQQSKFFQKKTKFWSKIEMENKSKFGSKMLVKNRNFGFKKRILVSKMRNFGQITTFWPTIKIFSKNRNFGQKSKLRFFLIEIENKIKLEKYWNLDFLPFVFQNNSEKQHFYNIFLDLNRDEINVEAMTELQKQLTSIEVERDMVTDQLCELERRLNQEQEKFNLRSQLADDKLAVSNQEKEMIKEQSSKLSQFVSTLTAENEKLVNDRDIIRKVVFSLV